MRAWIAWIVCGVPFVLAACGGAGPGEGFAETDGAPVVSWADFRARAIAVPGGGFVFDGDTFASDVKALRRAWEAGLSGRGNALAVNVVDGADDRWDESRKRRLTWCVSTAFGARKRQVIEAMEAAAGAWERVADVGFEHVEAEDGRCTSANGAVVFDVRPVSGAPYLARSFFPSSARKQRELLVSDIAYTDRTPLVGVLRHELGHVLGFRHEHTRPEAGACFEDDAWRPLTSYDPMSVMHYPQCNGGGNVTLELSEDDAAGAANLYGAPAGARTPSTRGGSESLPVLVSGRLTAGGSALQGPISVTSGRSLSLAFEGPAGSRMWLRFGGKPTSERFDLALTAGDTRTLPVPSHRRVAYVLVTSNRTGNWALRAAMTSAAPRTTTGTAHHAFSGNLGEGASRLHGPIPVRPGDTIDVDVTGSGDPDLTLLFGPTAARAWIACESDSEGPDACRATVPEDVDTAWLLVRAASPTRYEATLGAE